MYVHTDMAVVIFEGLNRTLCTDMIKVLLLMLLLFFFHIMQKFNLVFQPLLLFPFSLSYSFKYVLKCMCHLYICILPLSIFGLCDLFRRKLLIVIFYFIIFFIRTHSILSINILAIWVHRFSVNTMSAYKHFSLKETYDIKKMVKFFGRFSKQSEKYVECFCLKTITYHTLNRFDIVCTLLFFDII